MELTLDQEHVGQALEGLLTDKQPPEKKPPEGGFFAPTQIWVGAGTNQNEWRTPNS
jgi:hypothetical protein